MARASSNNNVTPSLNSAVLPGVVPRALRRTYLLSAYMYPEAGYDEPPPSQGNLRHRQGSIAGALLLGSQAWSFQRWNCQIWTAPLSPPAVWHQQVTGAPPRCAAPSLQSAGPMLPLCFPHSRHVGLFPDEETEARSRKGTQRASGTAETTSAS